MAREVNNTLMAAYSANDSYVTGETSASVTLEPTEGGFEIVTDSFYPAFVLLSLIEQPVRPKQVAEVLAFLGAAASVHAIRVRNDLLHVYNELIKDADQEL